MGLLWRTGASPQAGAAVGPLAVAGVSWRGCNGGVGLALKQEFDRTMAARMAWMTSGRVIR